jgi:lipopolysaccharide/colanic/teichoic acid biosynthesis glycosyltransferase
VGTDSHRLGAKRVFDLVLTLVTAPVWGTALGVIAVVVRLLEGSPIFFRQVRPGFQGQPFELLKFRSMSNHRDQTGRLVPDHDRITSVGAFLRKSSLDELPELINVLRGDMSLVGPRPLLMEYLDRYSTEQWRRHEVLPGLTGWAQVNGRNDQTWEDRLNMDVWYVDHQSLWLDLRILARTIGAVLTRRGISAEGHATMPKFGEEG